MVDLNVPGVVCLSLGAGSMIASQTQITCLNECNHLAYVVVAEGIIYTAISSCCETKYINAKYESICSVTPLASPSCIIWFWSFKRELVDTFHIHSKVSPPAPLMGYFFAIVISYYDRDTNTIQCAYLNSPTRFGTWSSHIMGNIVHSTFQIGCQRGWFWMWTSIILLFMYYASFWFWDYRENSVFLVTIPD